MGKGVFQGHEACLNCGSRDNVAVWSDGKYCFGCAKTTSVYKGMSIEDLKKQIQYDEDKKNKRDRVPYLPADFTSNISPQGLEWLQKYGVTEEEINKYRIGWTDESESLVLPAFDVWNNLLLVQLRTFNPQVAGFSKYYTRGHPESVFWGVLPSGFDFARDAGKRLVVVEDFVSALRVGRQVEAMPLWGSNLSLGQIKKLSDRYERLDLWLDFDKAGLAKKLSIKAMPYFKKVSTIVTELDPKEYSDATVASHLGIVS